MRNTEALYTRRDEAQHQIDCIWAARNRAYAQIEAIVARLQEEAGCSARDARHLMDHVHDGLGDMLGDVLDRWQDERGEVDEAIGAVEWQDLTRSAPAVL